MQRLQLRIPYVILEDARLLAEQRARTPAHILRRALAIGLVELREDSRKPEKEVKRKA